MVVLPFFTPAMPLYGEMPPAPVISRLVFWISKCSRGFPASCLPGNFALTVPQYSRKSCFCSPERAMSVRS